MHSALEEEIRGWLSTLAFRIRRCDIGVLLAAALCLIPLPPAMLIGLILAVSHLIVARDRLSTSELSLLRGGILVVVGYIAAWIVTIYWLSRVGELRAILDLVTNWASWLIQTLEPSFLRRVHPSSPLLHQA